MKWSLEIYSGENETNAGVVKALSHGITPVIRIGSEQVGGPTAEAYTTYLVQLDEQLTAAGIQGVVYAIAGPNEPETETWWMPRGP